MYVWGLVENFLDRFDARGGQRMVLGNEDCGQARLDLHGAFQLIAANLGVTLLPAPTRTRKQVIGHKREGAFRTVMTSLMIFSTVAMMFSTLVSGMGRMSTSVCA
jgi:hypothetical protein